MHTVLATSIHLIVYWRLKYPFYFVCHIYSSFQYHQLKRYRRKNMDIDWTIFVSEIYALLVNSVDR